MKFPLRDARELRRVKDFLSDPQAIALVACDPAWRRYMETIMEVLRMTRTDQTAPCGEAWDGIPSAAEPGQKVYPTGSVRSADTDHLRYDLISPVGLRRLAETYASGAKKYNDHNWRKGQPFSDVLNHAIAHLYKYLYGDCSEDHLAHAAWGLFALMEFEETRPELNDLYQFRRGDAS